MNGKKIQFKLKGYIYDGIVEDENMHNGQRILVKRFLSSGGYDYQLIHNWNIIG